MSANRSNKPSTRGRSAVESLEGRRLLAVLRPDHIVVVIEQDRASDAVGNPLMPYITSLASTGLNYANAHGVTHPSEPNTAAIFSGSTQGVTDNGRGYSFGGSNLAKSLFDAGQSFAGYVENLPADGSQVQQAGTQAVPDLYTRNLNAAAQFTNYGIDPATGLARTNAKVNRAFGAFSSLPTNDYSSLPTVSFVVPNNLHSTHGSNEVYPYAGSADESNNDVLRKSADDWLKANLDGYLQWARANNSLLIVTQDEERWTGGTATTVTTIVNGDADLFVAGTNATSINHYNVLRTIEDMYALPLLGDTATAAPLAVDALGRLLPDGVAPPASTATTTTLAKTLTSTVAGQSVTFTATVKGTSGTPSGSVTFRDGTAVLGTAPLNVAGIATFATGALGVGSHSITAAYGAVTPFTASTSSALSHAVAKAATSVTVTSTVASSAVGQSVTFSAAVGVVSPGTSAVAGTVQFQVDGANFGAAVTIVNGVATSKATTALGKGTHTITATYAGSATLLGSTSAAFAQVVGAVKYDDFASAAILSGNAVTFAGSNVGATKQTGEPKHAGNAGGKSIWATWTATSSGAVVVDTLGSTFDTLLAVYAGTAVNALTLVKQNDDVSGGNTQSQLTFAAVAGTTYRIAVDGYGGASGSITMHLGAGASAAASTAANKTPAASLWSAIAILSK